MSPEIFAGATTLAAGTGLILESSDHVCLKETVAFLSERSLLLVITNMDRFSETAPLLAVSGCPMAVPCNGVEDILKSVLEAEGLDASSIVLWPRAVSMKGCLEMCTKLSRLGSEKGFPQASHLMMIRIWSSEYALFVSSVSTICGCVLMVLDDLDLDGCSVLESLISWM